MSLSQVRTRLRGHRVAIEHAACAHGVEHISVRRACSCRGGVLAGASCARSLVRVLGASPALAVGFQRLHGARKRGTQLLQPSAPQAPEGASAPLPCRTAMQVGASCVRSLAPSAGASPAPRGAPHAHHVARERGARAHTCAPSQPATCATDRRQPTRHGYRRASRMNSIRAYSARSRRLGVPHSCNCAISACPAGCNSGLWRGRTQRSRRRSDVTRRNDQSSRPDNFPRMRLWEVRAA